MILVDIAIFIGILDKINPNMSEEESDEIKSAAMLAILSTILSIILFVVRKMLETSTLKESISSICHDEMMGNKLWLPYRRNLRSEDASSVNFNEHLYLYVRMATPLLMTYIKKPF